MFCILKQCPIFFRGRNLWNLWAKHLILVGYYVGLNLHHSPKIVKLKIVERIASAALILKNSFNCESSNLIYVVIFQGCKEEYIGETGCLMKEQINIYRQHIRQLQYQQLAVEEHSHICGDWRFHMFPFFKIIQESISLRKLHENYFIDKFKPLRNKKT